MKGRTSDAKNMLTSLQRKYKLKSTTQTGRRHPAGKKAAHKPLVSESTSYNVIHQKAIVFVSPHLSSPESHTTNHRACPVSWKTGVNTSCLTWFILGEDSWDDNGGNQKNPHVQKAPYINSFSTEDRTRRCCCWNSLYGRKKKKKKGSSLLVIWLCGLLLWSAWILPDGYMKVRALDGYRLSPPIGQWGGQQSAAQNKLCFTDCHIFCNFSKQRICFNLCMYFYLHKKD